MDNTYIIRNMDCIDGMKTINDKSIDAVITDPPYFIEGLKENMQGKTIRGSSKNDVFHAEWDHFETLNHYKKFMLELLLSLKRVLKEKGQVYMFMSFHHIDWLITMIKECGFKFMRQLIFFKPDLSGLFPKQYGFNYDPILWFRNDEKGGSVINNVITGEKDVFMYHSTNIKYRKECGFHPTPKPYELVKKLIKNCTNPDQVVLDPFLGSGTTMKACKEMGRSCIGFETNKEYIPIIERRLNAIKRITQYKVEAWQ